MQYEASSGADPVGLRLTRQFNWPTGITPGQVVRIRIFAEPNTSLHGQLDGDGLEFTTRDEVWLSRPILAQAAGARKLELSLEFDNIVAVTMQNPLLGIWLQIELDGNFQDR